MNPQDTQKQIPEFELDTANKIWWPVNVAIPVDGGKLAEFQFEAEFNVLSEAEYDAILGEKKANDARQLAEMLAAQPNVLSQGEYEALLRDNAAADGGKKVSEILEENFGKIRQIVTGWRKIKRNGADVPFSEAELRAQLTGKYGRALSTGIWGALTQIRYGIVVGNFEPLPGTGQQAAPVADEQTL